MTSHTDGADAAPTPSSDGGPSPGDLLPVAVEAAQAGAEVLRHYFRRSDLKVETKKGYDLVTQADHESERQVLKILQTAFPGHRVLAEESGWSAEQGEFSWFVDPLDGTSNFSQGLPTFCVSIACRRGEELQAGVVLDPQGDNLFTAERGGGAFWNGEVMKVASRETLDGAFLATGYPFKARESLDLYLKVFRDVLLRARGIRRCGSAALDLAYTAAGVYDGFFEFRLSPWDFAAGALLLEEAGGKITDLDGGAGYFRGGNLIAGSQGVHRQLLAVANDHVDESALDGVHPLG